MARSAARRRTAQVRTCCRRQHDVAAALVAPGRDPPACRARPCARRHRAAARRGLDCVSRGDCRPAPLRSCTRGRSRAPEWLEARSPRSKPRPASIVARWRTTRGRSASRTSCARCARARSTSPTAAPRRGGTRQPRRGCAAPRGRAPARRPSLDERVTTLMQGLACRAACSHRIEARTGGVGEHVRTTSSSVNANPGQPPDAGQGGLGRELSRISLALQWRRSMRSTCLLVFDEVDAGVGARCRDGRRQLRHCRLGTGLCVNTCAGAAQADHQVRVRKLTANGQTQTSLEFSRRAACRGTGADARRRADHLADARARARDAAGGTRTAAAADRTRR